MTFKERIDNILKTNNLGINSPSGLETYLKVSTGSISRPYKKGKSAGRAIVKKIKDGLGIPDKDWEAGDFGQNDGAVSSDKHLISTLERLVESKNEEILRLQRTQDRLMKMIELLNGGGGGPVE